MSDYEIRKGQIWKEVDPRFERRVIITDVVEGRRGIQVQGVVPDFNYGWKPAPRSRKAWCDRERFNGKRGGYELFEQDF